jgi:simple sugar transport system permease protein
LSKAIPILAVATCLALVLVLTLAALGLPVGQSLRLMGEGAFGGEAAAGRTLARLTPLLLTGLGMVVAWRAGMYNIGGEGQYVMGGLAGAWLAQGLIGAPPAILNLAILAATVVGGALYAGLAAWLHVSRGVQVVVSTILFNFIALQVLDWAVSGPLQEGKRQVPQTERLPEAAMLLRFDRQTDLHTGVFIALACALAVWVYLFLTRDGFRLRLVGENQRAARAQRIAVGPAQIRAMLLSGALCGLAGGVEYTGLLGQLDRGFAQQWGFLGIPVALLGGLHPLGAIASAGFFGALFAGLQNLTAFAQAATSIVYVIQGAAVLAIVGIMILLSRRAAPVEDP